MRAEALDRSSDTLLVEKFRRGDVHAFNAIHAKYYGPLMFFATELLLQVAEAEDVVADSFYKLYQSRERIQDIHHARNFLYRVTKNSSIDIMRHRARKEEIEAEFARMHVHEEGVSEQEMLQSAVLAAVKKEIDALPGECGRIFKLLFYDNMNSSAVAELLGISRSTVLNQKARALKKLRLKLLNHELVIGSLLLFFLAVTLNP